jgi:hypothetical protein
LKLLKQYDIIASKQCVTKATYKNNAIEFICSTFSLLEWRNNENVQGGLKLSGMTVYILGWVVKIVFDETLGKVVLGLQYQ